MRCWRCGSASAHLLGLHIWILLGTWMLVFCGCCVLSGRSLCSWVITHPEGSYQVWWVWVWSRSLDNGMPMLTRAVNPQIKKWTDNFDAGGVGWVFMLVDFGEAACSLFLLFWQLNQVIQTGGRKLTCIMMIAVCILSIQWYGHCTVKKMYENVFKQCC
jgi:hypothetical protein